MSLKLLTATLEYVFQTHRHQPLQITRWTAQREFKDFTATSQEITLPTGSALIELTATQNCFIKFGATPVTATTVIADDGSRLFLAGVQVIAVPLDGSNDPFVSMAVIRESVDGTLQVEKVE